MKTGLNVLKLGYRTPENPSATGRPGFPLKHISQTLLPPARLRPLSTRFRFNAVQRVFYTF